MAKKANVVVMAERLFSLAEDQIIEKVLASFGFKKAAEGVEGAKATNENYAKAQQLVKAHLRDFVRTMNTHGVLSQEILVQIGVLADEA